MTSARAKTKEDKQLKHQLIIDAAEQLFKQQHQLTTVATIAKTSEQAKGTVYLYFSSKETIYLSLLKQHYQIWFDQLNQTISQSHSLAEILTCFVSYPVKSDVFFYLASLSSSTLEPASDKEFKQQYYDWYNQAFDELAQLIVQQFPVLNNQQSLSLLNDSHAQLLGLWQQQTRLPDTSFEVNAKAALARLWKGYFSK
ncbi:TetR/AcrR family transcriptional regulator [Psychrobium sp. 1_MG-2023]|uniref:TetR/AcrR family transcriptional regulator n=1 Tax=Psychrobium sp. 1_MG-2023 TaxID=3062624 RepID=UPI000C333352|nr:TetR/AcrR family transcriptional regulator [Psychrobium sp. 1_MG-2023]MDP2560488.1 TetR/AcrR family transcriptional regulator [Psychrobium sp. 1_MG-2023]PKF57853.1 hypothetical protein CW748_04870 [Alteromonadales bacterium alter-6D02]